MERSIQEGKVLVLFMIGNPPKFFGLYGTPFEFIWARPCNFFVWYDGEVNECDKVSVIIASKIKENWGIDYQQIAKENQNRIINVSWKIKSGSNSNSWTVEATQTLC